MKPKSINYKKKIRDEVLKPKIMTSEINMSEFDRVSFLKALNISDAFLDKILESIKEYEGKI